MQVLEEAGRQLVGAGGAARAAVLPVRVEHEVVDDQLGATLEQVDEARRPVRPVEHVVLLDLDHRQLAALDVERVASPVSSFSLASSSLRAASHSSRVAIRGRLITVLLCVWGRPVVRPCHDPELIAA